MAETTGQLPTGPSAFLKLPNELIHQVAGKLPDKSLGNLRVANKFLRDITLEVWKKRALQDKDGSSALDWAAQKNKHTLIDYLFSIFPGIEINTARGGGHKNPLCIACSLGMNEAAAALIRHGADINYVPGASSALMQAVYGGHYTIVQMLLQQNADPHVLEFGNSNIIQVAARDDNVPTLRVILNRMRAYPELMPGIDDVTMEGYTALHLASEVGAASAAKLLLEFGADVDPVCGGDRFETPLARAVRILPFGRVAMAALLLSWGANIDGRTDESWTTLKFDTPLHSAVRTELADKYELVSLLISHGAALNALDHLGSTLMHSALTREDLDMISLIIARGGNINMVDGGGSSAFHLFASWRATQRTYETVTFFKQNGADIFLLNNAGMTPRDCALRSGWSRGLIEATWGGGVTFRGVF